MRLNFLICAFILAPGLFAKANAPQVDAVVDWMHNKISMRAEWRLNRQSAERSAGSLRAEVRTAMLAKLSSVIQSIFDRTTNGERSVDLAEFWPTLRLQSFQIAENNASATMDIPLRGTNSVLSYLAVSGTRDVWREDSAPLANAYERRADMNEYDASNGEPLLYTGLVVDARHLPFVPSLKTDIFTSSGRLLYGASYLTRATLVKRGSVGFFANESASEARRRAGKRPLKVAALDLNHSMDNAIVISDEDAAKLLAHDGSVKNLQRARVVILLADDKLREKY